MKRIKSRENCITIIDRQNKREMFVNIYGRQPEEYFSEYAYKEPEIWFWVMDDLGMKRLPL
jgi:hypothetical protein